MSKIGEIGRGLLAEVITGYQQSKGPTKDFVMIRDDEHTFRIVKSSRITTELNGYVYFRDISHELEEWVKDVGVI